MTVVKFVESPLGFILREVKEQKNYVKRAPDKLREGLKLVNGKLHFIPPYIDLNAKQGTEIKKLPDGKNLGPIWFPFSVKPFKPMIVQILRSGGVVHYSYWNGEMFSTTCSKPDRVMRNDNPNFRSIGIYLNEYTHWATL